MPVYHIQLFNSCLYFMFTVCYHDTDSEEADNMVNACVLYPASSTAFHYRVGNVSHLEWIDSLGDCLISLCAKVSIILSLHLLQGMRSAGRYTEYIVILRHYLCTVLIPADFFLCRDIVISRYSLRFDRYFK